MSLTASMLWKEDMELIVKLGFCTSESNHGGDGGESLKSEIGLLVRGRGVSTMTTKSCFLRSRLHLCVNFWFAKTE